MGTSNYCLSRGGTMNKLFIFPLSLLFIAHTHHSNTAQNNNQQPIFVNTITSNKVTLIQAADINRNLFTNKINTPTGKYYEQSVMCIHSPTTYEANSTYKYRLLVGNETITIIGPNVVIEAQDTSGFTGIIKCLKGATCTVRTKTPAEQRNFKLQEEDLLSLKVEEHID